MSSSELSVESLHQLVTETVLGPDFRRATFGGPVRGPASFPWLRVVLRPVAISGQPHVQFSYFDATKNVTRNHPGRLIVPPLDELLGVHFANIHLTTRTEEVDIRTTKKGKVFVSRRSVEGEPVGPRPHNRTKDVPLPEGQADRVLEVMGILTRDGTVRPTMRAKYTQINQFLKQLTHVLDEGWVRALGREVRILDCGCGASYLTLAVHHYLNDVLGIPARILGVDVNEEVIRKSVERSERLGAERLEFAAGLIGTLDTKPDIVLALHACDTATDDAISLAIRSEARVLLSVPCCHHHLNDRLRAEGAASVLRPMLRHGILHQRTADLVTDSFRALVLRILGYRTDVVEFISTEHTARNLMIRAVSGLPIRDEAFVREYVEMREFWGVTPYIETALGDLFRAVLSVTPSLEQSL
jgi:hypothetical protein